MSQHRGEVHFAVMGKGRDSRATRVLLVDDHLIVRSGVRDLLNAAEGFDVVGEAGDGDDALRLARELRPDLIVLDHEMPRRRGLDVLPELRRNVPRARVVMFTLDASIERDAFALGASAFLSKDASADTIINTLRGLAGTERSAAGGPSAKRRGLRLPAMTRWPRAPFVVLGLLLAYVGLFLVTEPALGAGAGALSVLPVALAGALLGPELGLLSAVSTIMVTSILWAASGHLLGEPILRVGGNGIGMVMLLALGAGFGALREIGGRLDRRGRRVYAIAEAARSMVGVTASDQLSILVEAAMRLVPAKAVLLYAPSDGGLEVAAAAGALRALVGGRATTESVLVERVLREGSARVFADFAREAPALPFVGFRSAAVLPARDAAGPVRGVLVVLHPRSDAYSLDELAALRPLAQFASMALGIPEQTVRIGGSEVRPVNESSAHRVGHP